MSRDHAEGPARARDGGRRFLLTSVVSRYHHDSRWNRETLRDDLDLMVELFSRDLGYEHVPAMGLDPTWLQIQDALREFCTAPGRRADDYVALYLAGHGEILPVGATGAEHVLLPADADPGDLRRRAIKSADLAEWMLAETKVRRLLVMVDACFSGQGGVDFARNAAAWTGSAARFGEQDDVGVVMVSATQPKQAAIAGMFAAGFARAVRSQASAGHAPGGLSIDALVNVLNSDPRMPVSQRAQWSLLLGSGKIPDFLPNPRRDVALVDLNLAEQARRWQDRADQEHQRAKELRDRFLPRAAGFIGRHRALTDLSRWLDDTADTRPRVVIGDPGSGKTAILGLLAALSDPRRRPTVPRDGLPSGIVSRAGVIDVAVYAGNLTSGQVLAALATAAYIDDIDLDPAALDLGVARLLTRLRERDRPLVAMVDALDEAVDPVHLAQRLLRPLIEDGMGGVRLVLGTRRHVCDHLGTGWAERCDVIDLDGPDYADPTSMAALVRRILRQGDTAAADTQTGISPFTSCSAAVLESVIAAIAEAAGQSFFVARILAATQASEPAVPDPADPAWRASLPSQAGPAMRRDLDTRLGENATRAMHLLLPLAYAQGAGLPWEDIWPLLANALSPGHGYTNEDLLWLADHAGSYIVESGTLVGRSLYRLYHQSLAEHLRGGRDPHADEHAIAAALAGRVPLRENGRPDWPAAHPYTRAHLATHAARGSTIDDLAQDPGFLLAAEPLQLLAALDTTANQRSQAAADAYRRALPFLRRHPSAEHAAYLSLGARRGRAEGIADRITADGLESPWTPRWASWQLRRPLQEPDGRPSPVWAVAVAELNGRPVAVSGSDDHRVQVWDLATGTPVGNPLTGHTSPVWKVAVAELNGRPVVVSGSADRTVRIWDLASGTPVGNPLTGHTSTVNAVAVAELNGRPVAVSGSDDQTVRTWDLATGAAVGGPFTGHTSPVWAMAVAELDSRPVAVSGSDDDTVRIWDLATGAPVGDPFTGHTGPVWAVAVAELDGRPVAVSGGADRTVQVWDLATRAPVGDRLTGHAGTVSAVAVAQLGGRPVAVTGSDDRTVRIWDLATGTPVGKPLTRQARTATAAAAAELNGPPVAVSRSDDHAVQAADPATGTPVGDLFTGHTSWVRAVAVGELAGRPVVVSGSSDRSVRIWDLATGAPVGEPLTGHSSRVRAVAVAELDGRPVAISGSADHTVQVWDLPTGTPVGEPFTGHEGPVWAVAVAKLNGRPVAISGSEDHTAQVWDLATRAPVGDPFTGHTSWVRAVAVARLNGRPVAVSGSADRTVQVWDLATRTPVGDPFTGHEGPVWAVAVTELAGRLVAVSGSDDHTVRIWDLANGTPVGGPFTGHTGPVLSVTIAALAGRSDPRARNMPVHLVIAEGDVVSVQALSRVADTTTWTQIVAPQIGSRVFATAWHPPRTLVVGAELGMVVLEVPSLYSSGRSLSVC
jgi:WD40 repeat protein